MKDLTIHISRRRQRTELITFIVCFVIAFATNVWAIIEYDSPWSELITSIFYVITFAVALYVAWGCVRLLWHALRGMRKKKNNK